jgi:citrate synthase
VFFGGAAVLQAELLGAVEGLPPELAPIDAVRIAVESASRLMHGRREPARERQRIVARHADLQERELIKRATLTAALARALNKRGASEPAASLAAEMGLTVFTWHSAVGSTIRSVATSSRSFVRDSLNSKPSLPAALARRA